ncbi:MAG: FAD-dependent oxidoreductase [Verrucomicrobia bacterium]|nr:MAG: FAD-dependent oxidoreductase [Verrucomicrobiota bacterium]
MNVDFDIAVVGSGFGGSLMAMIARRLGRSVILLERGKHPRFVIGESSTPLANLLLEELARRYELPRLLPLTKWGTWQKVYPHIGCGLKRGFTFYHHQFGQPFAADPERRDQVLVAASPRDEIADTHWYRPDFDHFLVREAQSLGVEYLDQAKLGGVSIGSDSVQVEGEHEGRRFAIRSRFVVDASGPRGFLHRALRLPEASFENFPRTQALYAHFTGVKRWEDLGGVSQKRPGGEPPYPVDDAAVHHIFDGGWIWVLRFNNGVTSAGVAATEETANRLCLAEGAAAWDRVLERLPTLREQFADAKAQFSFLHTPRLSFRSGAVVGPRWALLPSAAGFVDPLLSTGFPLTLLGVGPLYANMNDFPFFAALSLLYFAAASFSEAARRLDRPDLASGFLLHDHPCFGPLLRSCCERASCARENDGLTAAVRNELIDDIFGVIEPVDVAGLSDRSRRNWYPVEARDLLNAAAKLGVRELDIKRALARGGFFPAQDFAAEGAAGASVRCCHGNE